MTRAEVRPLWREQYPTSPLTKEEQTRFEGLTWINQSIRDMEFPQPNFGVNHIILGESAQITMVTQDEEGNLVKRVIPEPEGDTTMRYLGSGPSVPEHTLCVNDSLVNYGPVNHSSSRRIVIFQKSIGMNSETVQRAINLAEEFWTTIQQDKIARKVKQAEQDLVGNLGFIAQDSTQLKLLTKSLGTKLQEAAIESGLLQTSRGQLPKKIRGLAKAIEEAGIKCIEFKSDLSVYWPDGIRQSWTPETDGLAWREWQNSRS